MKLSVWLLTVYLALTGTALADYDLPAQAVPVPGAPVQAVGCTAARGDSEGGYVSDFYIRGNASFENESTQPATEVLINIHYAGAYGDHDALLDKKGTFSPGTRIDPKRRAWVAVLQPETLNIDTDGAREIDLWGTVSATCTVVGAVFADGTVWRIGQSVKPAPYTPANIPAQKCSYDSKTKQYVCS